MSAQKCSYFAWINIFVVMALSPFFLFPSSKSSWILFIPLGILAIGSISNKQILEPTILDWPVLILSIQVFITCLIVPDLVFSLPKIAGFIFGVYTFYSLVSVLKSEKLLKTSIIAFLTTGFAFSLFGIVGMKATDEKDKYLFFLSKIKGLLPNINMNMPGAEEGFNPNAVGGTVVLFIPLFILLLYPYFRRRKEDFRIIKNKSFLAFLLLGLSIFIFAVLITQSRPSWIGILLACWLILAAFWNEREIQFKTGILTAIILFIILVLAYSFLVRPARINLATQELNKKMNARLQAWSVGIDTVKNHPLTGLGMNRIRLEPGIGYERAHAHNHLIQTAAELGLPGLIAYMSIMILYGFMGYYVWKKAKMGWTRYAALGLVSGQFAHFVFGIVDSIPIGAKVGVAFWISLGLMTAMYNCNLHQDDIKTNS